MNHQGFYRITVGLMLGLLIACSNQGPSASTTSAAEDGAAASFLDIIFKADNKGRCKAMVYKVIGDCRTSIHERQKAVAAAVTLARQLTASDSKLRSQPDVFDFGFDLARHESGAASITTQDVSAEAYGASWAYTRTPTTFSVEPPRMRLLVGFPYQGRGDDLNRAGWIGAIATKHVAPGYCAKVVTRDQLHLESEYASLLTELIPLANDAGKQLRASLGNLCPPSDSLKRASCVVDTEL